MTDCDVHINFAIVQMCVLCFMAIFTTEIESTSSGSMAVRLMVVTLSEPLKVNTSPTGLSILVMYNDFSLASKNLRLTTPTFTSS